MLRRVLLFLLFPLSVIRVQGQNIMDRCSSLACNGIAPPTGSCVGDYIYKDLSQVPAVPYTCKAGAWVPLGASGGAPVGQQFRIGAYTGAGSGSNTQLGQSNAFTDVTGNPITVPGTLTSKTFGGTSDATLNQTNPLTPTNDGIHNSLQKPGAVVTVNQGYPSVEGIVSGASWRSPACCGGTGINSPGMANDVTQIDYRADNLGLFMYNPPGTLNRGNIYDLFLNDNKAPGQSGGFQWVYNEVDQLMLGSGKNQQNLGSAGNWDVTSLELHNLYDFTRGISQNEAFEAFKGEGDFQGYQCQVHAHGDDPEGSGEGKTCYRNEMLQDASVWFGPAVQTYPTGATVVNNGHNASAPYAYDADYLVDSTQAGTPFYMTFGAAFDEPGQNPGQIGTPLVTWTPDNMGKLTADFAQFSVPQQYNGLGTPITVSVSGLASAFTTTTKVCVADTSNNETIQIPSTGTTFAGGVMTFTANFRFWHSGGATFSQGPQSCTYLEVLANQAGTWRNLVPIVGAKDAHTLLYSAHLLGGWANEPDGSFSTQNIPASTAFVRDASGNVTVTLPSVFAGGNWNAQQITINANSGLPSNLFGSWDITETDGPIVSEAFQQILTFSTGIAGAAGTSTSTGPVYVSKFGLEANTGRLMPGAEIVYAGNPATHVNDGSVQIALNDMTINSGDQLESQAGPEVVMTLTHDQIAMMTPTSSQSSSVGHYDQVTGRPAAGFVWHQYPDNTEANYFAGDGGVHPGMIFAEIGGNHYNNYWVMGQPMPTQGGGVFTINGCGTVPNSQCANIRNPGWAWLAINTPLGGYSSGFSNWNSLWGETVRGPSGGVTENRWGGNFLQNSGEQGAPGAGWDMVETDSANGAGGEFGTDVFNGTRMLFHHGGNDSEVIAETSQLHLQVFSSGASPAMDFTTTGLSMPAVPTTFPAKNTATFGGQLPCLADGTNCSSSGITAGTATVAASGTTSIVGTTAVTANSQILLTWDSSLGTKLGVTCNTTPTLLAVTARTPGTSFTVTSGTLATNPACFSYMIIH